MPEFKMESPLKSENPFTKNWGKKVPTELDIFDKISAEGETLTSYLERVKSEELGQQSEYYGMGMDEIMKIKAAYRKAGKTPPDTAFEEALKAAGISVSGDNSDFLSKFFTFSGSEVLFQEFLFGKIYTGLLRAPIIQEFTALSTNVTADTFEALYLDDEEDDRDMYEIAKYQDLPKTTIKVSEKTGHMNLYGRYLELSKFDKNRTRLNVLGKFLEKMSEQIGVTMTDRGFHVLINGDGNYTTPSVTETASTSGQYNSSLKEKIEWWYALTTPYKMDKFVMRKDGIIQYVTDLFDPQVTSLAYSNGMIDMPQHFEWDRSVISAGYAYGVDSRYALEYVHNGGVQTESGKNIRNLTEGMSIYHQYQFRILDDNARAKWDLSS